jgi:hypothetical protein
VKRNRILYLAGTCLVIALGMASRRYASMLPSFVGRYAGDTLWAVMVFGLIGIVATRWSSLRVAIATLIVSYGVEVSQLHHAPWIDTIRDSRIGGLVLGYGFLWSDIVCYTAGVAICLVLEHEFLRPRGREAANLYR